MAEEIANKFGLVVYLTKEDYKNEERGSDQPIVSSNFKDFYKDGESDRDENEQDHQNTLLLHNDHTNKETQACIISLNYKKSENTNHWCYQSTNGTDPDLDYTKIQVGISEKRIKIFDLSSQTYGIEDKVQNIIKDYVWEDEIDIDSERVIWKILRVFAKYFCAILFACITIASCLISKLSILELAKLKPIIQKPNLLPPGQSFIADSTPLLPLSICLLVAEGMSFLFAANNSIFKKDTCIKSTNYRLLLKLMISEILDLIGQSIFILYTIVFLRINLTIFSMSTIYLVPLLVKTFLPIKKTSEKSLTEKILLWSALFLRVFRLNEC